VDLLAAYSFPQQMLLVFGRANIHCIHYTFYFSFAASHITLSEAAWKDPDPATHCLASQAFL
jgi:hypothetical protein